VVLVTDDESTASARMWIVAEWMDTDDLFSLTAEVINGIGPETSTLPDTPLVRETREKLKKEVAKILAKGLVPDVPHEW